MQLKPPGHLNADGAALWDAIAREYHIDDSGGQALLTIAAECLDRLRAAQKAIDEHGEVVEDRYGGLKAHPAVQIEKDSRNGLLAALKALNLDLEPLRDRPGNPGIGGVGIRSVK